MEELEGKRLSERTRPRWVDIIKMDLKKIEWGGMGGMILHGLYNVIDQNSNVSPVIRGSQFENSDLAIVGVVK